MGVKVTNNGFGTLSAGINSSATTVTVDSGQGARFPTLSSGDFFFATLVDTSNNLEIIKVTARSTDSMTVTRAQDNTSARAFSIGDRIELRPTAALFDQLITDISNAGVAGITSSADATAITIDSSEQIGIGTASPQKLLHLKDGDIVVGNGTASNNAVIGRIGFSTDASNSRFIGIESFRGSDAANADLRFHTFGGDSDSGERVRIHTNGVLSASDGIALGVGTANTSSNVLDDYEEGTWTPSFVAATSQGTHYNRVGKYTRIGRLVVLQFFYQVGGTKPTFSNNASQFLISGIPFTVDGTGYTGSQGSVNAQALNYTSTYNNQGMGADYLSASVNSSEQLHFTTTNSGQTRGIVNNLAAAATHWIVEATVSYFTDA